MRTCRRQSSWQNSRLVLIGVGFFFLILVPDRSQETLLPIIRRYIRPGTLIISDEWRGYLNIPSIDGGNYYHQTVNHSRNFVDPETRAHTQNVENLWKNLKQKFKRMLGVHGTQLESHIDEFLWRNMFGKTAKEAFDNVLLHISEWYAVWFNIN